MELGSGRTCRRREVELCEAARSDATSACPHSPLSETASHVYFVCARVVCTHRPGQLNLLDETTVTVAMEANGVWSDLQTRQESGEVIF